VYWLRCTIQFVVFLYSLNVKRQELIEGGGDFNGDVYVVCDCGIVVVVVSHVSVVVVRVGRHADSTMHLHVGQQCFMQVHNNLRAIVHHKTAAYVAMVLLPLVQVQLLRIEQLDHDTCDM
jgi:hypothetical protein